MEVHGWATRIEPQTFRSQADTLTTERPGEGPRLYFHRLSEGGGEKHLSVASRSCPDRGRNPQPRCIPRVGINPETSGCLGQPSNPTELLARASHQSFSASPSAASCLSARPQPLQPGLQEPNQGPGAVLRSPLWLLGQQRLGRGGGYGPKGEWPGGGSMGWGGGGLWGWPSPQLRRSDGSFRKAPSSLHSLSSSAPFGRWATGESPAQGGGPMGEGRGFQGGEVG